MICTELYHGQTLTVVVVTLFRGTPLKYFSVLIDLLLMCYVCIISKAGIVQAFWNTVQWNQEFHFPPICQELLYFESKGNQLSREQG